MGGAPLLRDRFVRMPSRPTFAPKVPLAWITRLYELDVSGGQDDLAQRVGLRLWERCKDLLLVADSMLRCPACDTPFAVPWIGRPDTDASVCPGCGWSCTAGEYHALIEHRDLIGGQATTAFSTFVRDFPSATTYAERARLIDVLVHALHKTGGRAARNLIEGRAQDVLSQLDRLAGRAG
jgi:ribosomal protein L37AE/L43A